jgi:hypothetical protein
MPNFGLSSARAEASRRNGAKSRGPKTPEGKARSAQNALKHGLRAQKCVVLPGERASAFAAFEAALLEELAPQGALQSVLAQRVVAASWRLARSEQLEAELFARMMEGGSMGLALIRDSNGARSFDTLLRYRGGTLAELWRALRTLKALQAERAALAASAPVRSAVAAEAPEPARLAAIAPAPVAAPACMAQPDEPERRTNPCEQGPAGDCADCRSEPGPVPTWLPPQPRPESSEAAPCATPIEPEPRRQPAEPAPPRAGAMAKNGSASLLAGTALASACWPRAQVDRDVSLR